MTTGRINQVFNSFHPRRRLPPHRTAVPGSTETIRLGRSDHRTCHFQRRRAAKASNKRTSRCLANPPFPIRFLLRLPSFPPYEVGLYRTVRLVRPSVYQSTEQLGPKPLKTVGRFHAGGADNSLTPYQHRSQPGKHFDCL